MYLEKLKVDSNFEETGYRTQVKTIQRLIQKKKDPAVYDFGDKKSGEYTSTKVIKQKSGSLGLFKYRYGDNNVIDSFQGANNIAKAETAHGSPYAAVPVIGVDVAVSSHNLYSDYTDADGLSDKNVKEGGRGMHFNHADNAHKVDRSDKYTWHHLQTLGRMELIDMNVHGAMWHYGGIAGWKGSTHEADSDDDATDDS